MAGVCRGMWCVCVGCVVCVCVVCVWCGGVGGVSFSDGICMQNEDSNLFRFSLHTGFVQGHVYVLDRMSL